MSNHSMGRDDVKASCEVDVKSHEHPTPSTGRKSAGVAKIEALNAHTTTANRCCILFGILLVAWAYGLDGTLRGVYQPSATAGFNQHSTLAAINVLRSVIAAAAQPTAAKIGSFTLTAAQAHS